MAPSFAAHGLGGIRRRLGLASIVGGLAHGHELATIPGNPPNLMHRPTGCPFRDRCEYAFARCREERPALRGLPGGHLKACHLEEAP